jgi:hypothetical protein
VEFVFLLGIALFSGDGIVARILHSVINHEQAVLLIVSCAITSWLLRVAVLKNRAIRPNNQNDLRI